MAVVARGVEKLGRVGCDDERGERSCGHGRSRARDE